MPRKAVRIAALDQTRLFVRRRDDMFGWPPGMQQVNPMHQAFMLAAAGFNGNSMQQMNMGMSGTPFLAQQCPAPGGGPFLQAPGPQQGHAPPQSGVEGIMQQAAVQGANSSADHSRSPRRQVTDGSVDGGLCRFPDDDRKMSTAYRSLGCTWMVGEGRCCPKKFRMSLITSCNSQEYPMVRLSQLGEEQIDMLLYILTGILPSTRVQDLGCATKKEARAAIRSQYVVRLRRNASRLSVLAEELDNVAAVAVRLGYPPHLLSPELRRSFSILQAGAVAMHEEVNAHLARSDHTPTPHQTVIVPQPCALKALTAPSVIGGEHELALVAPCAVDASLAGQPSGSSALVATDAFGAALAGQPSGSSAATPLVVTRLPPLKLPCVGIKSKGKFDKIPETLEVEDKPLETPQIDTTPEVTEEILAKTSEVVAAVVENIETKIQGKLGPPALSIAQQKSALTIAQAFARSAAPK